MANKTSKPSKSQKALSKGSKHRKLAQGWRIFWLSLKALWRVRRYALPLFTAHILTIVFVTGNRVGPTQAQLLLSLVVIILISMMYITLLRAEAQDKFKITMPDIVYGGTRQIMPFLCLLSLVVLQVLPFAFGALIFQIAFSANIAILAWEQIAFGVLWLLMTIPSLYWLSSTLNALIIVTILDVRPLAAYQAAKDLVKGYIFSVATRMFIFTVVALAIIFGSVIAAFAAGHEMFALQLPNYLVAILVPLFWSYAFTLYRDLLGHE